MKLGFNLTLEQTQKLIMTQELRQAIELLQYNSVELNEYIKNQIQDNPMLAMEKNLKKMEKLENPPAEKEIDWKEFINQYDDISYRPQVDKNQEERSYESFVSYSPSLKEYLIEQLHLANIAKDRYIIGEYIVDSINSNGYLRTTVEEISSRFKIEVGEVEDILTIIQGFEPTGVGARDLKECLLIQVREDQDANPMVAKVIEEYLEDLGANRINKIAKELNIDVAEIQVISDYIRSLEPKPGRGFGHGNQDDIRYIVPDASIDLVDGNFIINIKDSAGPRLNINKYYKDLIQKDGDEKAKEFLTEKLNSALWVIKSIEQRRNTIYRVIESILKFQLEFFKSGTKGLVPLTLKDVAEDIEMHESTISRATNGKYVQTPRGLFELKYFFSSGLAASDGDMSSTNIKSMIESIVSGEDTKKPYSDQKISDILKEKGIEISRRTVAKYRDELRIPSSSMRRRYN